MISLVACFVVCHYQNSLALTQWGWSECLADSTTVLQFPQFSQVPRLIGYVVVQSKLWNDLFNLHTKTKGILKLEEFQ
eukprot:m.39322 g.39322  ORF g.39322 m.39322 type:complete len:78 (-) comp7944_c0_seq1:2838-3071(-)